MMGADGLRAATEAAILSGQLHRRAAGRPLPHPLQRRHRRHQGRRRGARMHPRPAAAEGQLRHQRRRRGQAPDRLRLPRADAELPGGRHADGRAHRERAAGRAGPLLRRDDRHPRRDRAGRKRRLAARRQPAEARAAHRRRRCSRPTGRTPTRRERGGLPGGRPAAAEVLGAGGPGRQRLGRPQPVLQLRAACRDADAADRRRDHGRLRLRPLQDRHRPDQLAHRRADARGAAVRAAPAARRPARRARRACGAELYGSLGATGKGHGSDKAVLLGLAGPRARHGRRRRHPGAAGGHARRSGRCTLLGAHAIAFDEKARPGLPPPRDPAASTPTACASRPSTPPARELAERVYYSVGGGFVVSDEVAADGSRQKAIAPDTTVLPLPVPQRRRAAGADAARAAAASPS